MSDEYQREIDHINEVAHEVEARMLARASAKERDEIALRLMPAAMQHMLTNETWSEAVTMAYLAADAFLLEREKQRAVAR